MKQRWFYIRYYIRRILKSFIQQGWSILTFVFTFILLIVVIIPDARSIFQTYAVSGMTLAEEATASGSFALKPVSGVTVEIGGFRTTVVNDPKVYQNHRSKSVPLYVKRSLIRDSRLGDLPG